MGSRPRVPILALSGIQHGHRDHFGSTMSKGGLSQSEGPMPWRRAGAPIWGKYQSSEGSDGTVLPI